MACTKWVASWFGEVSTWNAYRVVRDEYFSNHFKRNPNRNLPVALGTLPVPAGCQRCMSIQHRTQQKCWRTLYGRHIYPFLKMPHCTGRSCRGAHWVFTDMSKRVSTDEVGSRTMSSCSVPWSGLVQRIWVHLVIFTQYWPQCARRRAMSLEPGHQKLPGDCKYDLT